MALEDEVDVTKDDFLPPPENDENIGRENPAAKDKWPVSSPTETDPGAPDPED